MSQYSRVYMMPGPRGARDPIGGVFGITQNTLYKVLLQCPSITCYFKTNSLFT